MTKAQNDPGDPAEDPADGEDLAALITHALAETTRGQKELAHEAGIQYTRLNSWVTRARGTSRVNPDELRAIAEVLRRWGAKGVTVRRVFRAAGRPVPGPTDVEREKRLLEIYRQLPVSSQRALIDTAEALRQSLLAQ